MRVTKYFKPKNDNGKYEEKVYFAVDGKNVDMADGKNLEDKIKDMNTNISNNGETINSLDKKHTTLQAKVGAQGNDIADLKTKTANLENSITTSNSSITNLQTSVNTLNSKTSSLEGQIATHTSDIANLKTNVSNITKDISSLNDELALTCRFQATSLTCVLPDNL